mmetsp:Transcript_22182/g.10606  ORF Transcript_22182/g.10606 Transcript_22182/m.10606 type:complete len:258 (+) Transcript_22182:616-1389(+)
MFLARIHLSKVLGYIAHYFSSALTKPSVSYIIAGILICDWLFYFLGRIDFKFSSSQSLCHPLNIVNSLHRRLTGFNTGPVGAFYNSRSISMSTFGYHHSFRFQSIYSAVYFFHLHLTPLPVSCKHDKTCLFPALAGNCPVLSCKIKQYCCLADIFRIVLGLPCIYGVQNISIFFIHRNNKSRPFLFIFLSHPFTGIHPVFYGNIHLRSVYPVHTRTYLQLPWDKPLCKTQTSQISEHYSHVDAKGTVHSTAVTAGTL